MNGKGSNFLAAFVSGALLGSVLGILYAPDKGSSTREKLFFRLRKYKESLEELLSDLLEKKGSLFAGGEKTQEDEATFATKNKAERLLEDVDDLLNQIRGV